MAHGKMANCLVGLGFTAGEPGVARDEAGKVGRARKGAMLTNLDLIRRAMKCLKT